MTRAQRVWLTIGVTALSVVGYVGFAFCFFKYGGLLFSKPDSSATDSGSSDSSPTEHVHAFGDWITVKDPTCTELGRQERECECGEKETQILPKIEHKYQLTLEDFNIAEDGTVTSRGVIRCTNPGDYSVSYVNTDQGLYFDIQAEKKATCTENGWILYVGYCEYDGENIVAEKLMVTDPAIEHAVETWEVLTLPTNDTAGEAMGLCAHCGEELHVELPALTSKEYSESGTERLCGESVTFTYHAHDAEQLVTIDLTFTAEEVPHVWTDWMPISQEGYDGPYKWIRYCEKDHTHQEYSDSEEKPED